MTTALILFLILLLCSLLLADFSWSNVLSNNRNEVVFAGRNHDYGAYRIRQEHHRVMVLSMVLGFGLVGAATVIPSLFGSTGSAVPPLPRIKVLEIFTPPDDSPAAKPVEKPITTAPAPNPTPTTSGLVVAVDTSTRVVVDTALSAAGPAVPGAMGDTAARGPEPVATVVGGGGSGPKTIPPGRVADTQPVYPGGDNALYGDLDDELIYPERSIDIGEQGVVYVGFVVDRDGTITDVKVLRGVSPALDKEALRVVKRLKRWKPGTYEGEPVPVHFRLPIKFELGRN